MKAFKIFIVLFVSTLISCATSMSPIQVSQKLPNFTKSKFVMQSEADSLMNNGSCKYLVRNREYVAPIGFSAEDDLRNGAKGIDEWVKLDGGNAYILENFKWITVDNNGSTELHLKFSTLKCLPR